MPKRDNKEIARKQAARWASMSDEEREDWYEKLAQGRLRARMRREAEQRQAERVGEAFDKATMP